MSEFVMTPSENEKIARFYSRGTSRIEVEAERLQYTAVEFANSISKKNLAPFLKERGRVVDVGAGSDVHLGQEVEKDFGSEYIAVDPNTKFIEILESEGIDARLGDVSSVPVESNSADAVHMRFVFGWLNEEQRKSALKQSVRMLKSGGKTVVSIIDYDWLTTEGPEEYIEAVAVACDALKTFEFDYEFGNKLHAEVASLAAEGVLGGDDEYDILPLELVRVSRTLRNGGLALLTETATSLKEGLRFVGDLEREMAIDAALERLKRVDPDAEIVLPGIAVQTIVFSKKTDSPESEEDRLLKRPAPMEIHDYRADTFATSVEKVFKVLPGSALDDRVRRVQASEYWKGGLLKKVSVINKTTGKLRGYNYPESLVDRSTLYARMRDDMSVPLAAVRLIDAEKVGSQNSRLHSLPTAHHLNLNIEDTSVFPEGADAGGVIEISAFIRNAEAGGTLTDMARVIIAAAADAREKGYHTALMTTQERAYRLIKKMFGEENFHLLMGPHQSPTPGTSATINYVSLSVNVDTFLDGVRGYVLGKGSDTGVIRDISDILEKHTNTFHHG